MPTGPAAVAVSMKRRTQDAWGVLRADRGDHRPVRAAWVIDGATPLGASDPRTAGDQVSRFAWALSAGLRGALASDRHGAVPIAELVESGRAAAQAAIERGWPGAPVPTATLSLVRRTPHGLEAFALGDSPLWIDDGAELIEVCDPQFAGAEQRLTERWQELRAAGRTAAGAYAELLEGQAQDRRQRSTEGGIWILGESPRAAAHGTVRLLPGAAQRRVCLLSDGLERTVAPFGLTDRRGLFEALQAGRAGALVQRLRALERADAIRLAAPRLTTHDDVTGIAITL